MHQHKEPRNQPRKDPFFHMYSLGPHFLIFNSQLGPTRSDFVTVETGVHRAVQSDFLTVATNMQQSHELVTVSVVQKGWTF
jgi:hypothetical protein